VSKGWSYAHEAAPASFLCEGELHIGKLASAHGLTVADMESALAARLGTFVHGRVERQVLFTTAFIQKQTAAIVGALTAATRPLSTQDIIHRFRLQPELFESTLKQVLIFGTHCTLSMHAVADAFVAPTAYGLWAHQRRSLREAIYTRLVHSSPETCHQRIFSVQ
jgi:hypothetical protein